MALILRLENRKLPEDVKAIFKKAESGEAALRIPAMVFSEIAYLSEKKRIDTTLDESILYVERNHEITQVPMTFDTVSNSFEIDDIPELHDRLIAGSAKELNIPIITNDPVILSSAHVETVW